MVTVLVHPDTVTSIDCSPETGVLCPASCLMARVGAHQVYIKSSVLPAVLMPVCCPCRYVAQVAQINALEPSLRALTDAELAEQTLRFRAALERNRHRCGARQRAQGTE